MRIIFIRHGDPDYEMDTLTEKGWREARLLAERVCKWKVKDFYCSPLGRAKATASCSLEKMNRTAETYGWLREFSYTIEDPTTGRHGVPWDFMPSFWTMEPKFYEKDHWFEVPVFLENQELKPAYDEICEGIDRILACYGYNREGMYYRTPLKSNDFYSEDTIVIFCHLGVTFAMMSHLLGIAPTLLWQNFFIAPTSVTILNSEERMPEIAYFRSQVVGDTMHLTNSGESISKAGYFAVPFEQ